MAEQQPITFRAGGYDASLGSKLTIAASVGFPAGLAVFVLIATSQGGSGTGVVVLWIVAVLAAIAALFVVQGELSEWTFDVSSDELVVTRRGLGTKRTVIPRAEPDTVTVRDERARRLVAGPSPDQALELSSVRYNDQRLLVSNNESVTFETRDALRDALRATKTRSP